VGGEPESAAQGAALIEAILFMEAEPMPEARLAAASGLSPEAAEAALEELAERYSGEGSGLELSRVGGGVALAPKRDLWERLKERYGKKNDARISRAVMETLAIIAYSQPITKAEIRAFRGVSPDNAMQILAEKGLIEKAGQKDVPGKPTQYKTTREFLKRFRLNSIADLPRLSESDADRFELEGGS